MKLSRTERIPGWLLIVVFLISSISTTALSQDLITIGEEPDTPTSGPFGGVQNLPDAQDRYNFRAEEGLVFEGNVAYGEGRTTVDYEEFTMEADKMVIDLTSGNISAEGNVIFEGPTEFVRAERGKFNLYTSEGAAFGLDGQQSDFYFKAIWDEEKNGPSFRQIDEQTSIFRGSYVTTSSFPKPQYYIASQEIFFVKNERVFFKNPVLWVRGVPVMWLPYYSRSLTGGSPWSFEFGYGTEFGAYGRLGYRYIHQHKVPSFDDPEEYVTRSHGQLDAFLDWYSRRGTGFGGRYTYQINEGQHVGYVEAYGIRDRERDLEAQGQEPEDEEERWVYRHRNNSQIIENNLYLQFDIDEVSDPDVYTDFLDRWAVDGDFERGRMFERGMEGAITYRDDNMIARVGAEQKERLGRDTYQDPSEPGSDDLDFEPDLLFLLPTDPMDPEYDPIVEEDFDEDGIARNRFGRVRENVYGKLASRMLNIAGQNPLYVDGNARAFNSLDKGLNPVDTSDDTRVRGADIFGQVTHRLRFGERTTWLNSVGAGAASYKREDSILLPEDDINEAAIKTGEDMFTIIPPEQMTYPELGEGEEYVIPDARFADEETLILGGEGTSTVSFNDADNTYYFGQLDSRLSHRFTEFLQAYIRYFIREGTDDSLGEVYERMGYQEAFEDVHDFYTNRHFVEGNASYFLRYPNIIVSVLARENLQSGEDIYPNEQLRLVSSGITYISQERDFRAQIITFYEERQIRDRDDPNNYEQPTLGGNIVLRYFPKHYRYWAQLITSWSHRLEEDPVQQSAQVRRRFDEEDTEFIIEPTIGRQFGPKYKVQVGGRYNTRYQIWDEAGITIIRDLKDAEFGIFMGVTNNENAAREKEDENDEEIAEAGDTDFDEDRETVYEFDVRVNFRFKIGRDDPGLGQRSVMTLGDVERESQFVQ